jgi:hypothetical protein
MKNTRKRVSTANVDDMLPEYDFDWSKARPNPYAARLKDTVAVVLDPDVAEAFPTSESVNTFLRSVLAAVPRRTSAVASRRKRPQPSKGGLTTR